MIESVPRKSHRTPLASDKTKVIAASIIDWYRTYVVESGRYWCTLSEWWIYVNVSQNPNNERMVRSLVTTFQFSHFSTETSIFHFRYENGCNRQNTVNYNAQYI